MKIYSENACKILNLMFLFGVGNSIYNLNIILLFNIKYKYCESMDNTEQVNPFAMCIENQTIGFIYNSYLGSAKCHRQYSFGKYKVDLFFPQHKLVVECDENNHNVRDQQNEKEREEYILSLGNTMIRFNPNEPNFDLSNVLSKINRVIHMAVYSGCLN
jgi:very-short-patch-repair endonuclease